MSIVNAKEIMVEAAKNGYAVGAFNITDLLQFEAVIDAAIENEVTCDRTDFGEAIEVPRHEHDGCHLSARWRNPPPSPSACTSITAPRWITARNAPMPATPTS